MIVHPEGSEAARKTPDAQAFLRAGRSLLTIDAYQTGRAVEPREGSRPAAPHLQQEAIPPTDVQDILTASSSSLANNQPAS